MLESSKCQLDPAAINQVFEPIAEETGSAKELHSGTFLACPKMYELEAIASPIRITSFCASYLIPAWILGRLSTASTVGPVPAKDIRLIRPSRGPY
jgi:hypothetical protein